MDYVLFGKGERENIRLICSKRHCRQDYVRPLTPLKTGQAPSVFILQCAVSTLVPGVIHRSCDSFCQTFHWTRDFTLLGESQVTETRLECIKQLRHYSSLIALEQKCNDIFSPS